MKTTSIWYSWKWKLLETNLTFVWVWFPIQTCISLKPVAVLSWDEPFDYDYRHHCHQEDHDGVDLLFLQTWTIPKPPEPSCDSHSQSPSILCKSFSPSSWQGGFCAWWWSCAPMCSSVKPVKKSFGFLPMHEQHWTNIVCDCLNTTDWKILSLFEQLVRKLLWPGPAVYCSLSMYKTLRVRNIGKIFDVQYICFTFDVQCIYKTMQWV